MTTGPEDDVHWGNELKSLPSWVRSLVVAVRLGGPPMLVIILVSVIVGQALGLFEDQASRDRRESLKLLQLNTALLGETKEVSKNQLEAMSRHIETTQMILRTQCMFIPGITDHDRRKCIEGHSW